MGRCRRRARPRQPVQTLASAAPDLGWAHGGQGRANAVPAGDAGGGDSWPLEGLRPVTAQDASFCRSHWVPESRRRAGGRATLPRDTSFHFLVSVLKDDSTVLDDTVF